MDIERSEGASAVWYLLGGAAIGFALGLAAAPSLGVVTEADVPSGDEEPGLVSRLIKKIPIRVKVAGAMGAVKGAGSEAYREVKQKLGG